MILKALYDYYDRSGELPPIGWQLKEISFAIVIGDNGTFIRLEDMRDEKKRGRSIMVPQAVGRSSGILPNLMWDNVEYVLGYGDNPEKAARKMEAFAQKCFAVADSLHDDSLEAVKNFYETDQAAEVGKDPLWGEIEKKPTVNLTFRIQGAPKLVAEERNLTEVSSSNEKGEESNTCLVTGRQDKCVTITSATPILGGQAIGKLVAFQVKQGYDSYGKSQGANAPISTEAEAKYTSALNHLLRRDSHNKVVLGNGSSARTFLFWSAKQDELGKEMEESMFGLFGFSAEDNPDKNTTQIRQLFKDVFSGLRHTASDDRMYILGLAPNSARIAVVYWNVCTIKEFAGNITRHFDDMDIAGNKVEMRHAGLYNMLSATTISNKVADAQPNLMEATMKSILQRTPYPYPLFTACIARAKAEQKVSLVRAAIIKAYLNRTNTKNILTPMVNTNNTNPGYLCGRLLATVERLQERANGSSNICERYMTAASTTPASVFPTLLNLSLHHAEKVGGGLKVYFEKLKAEIIDKLEDDAFPAHLDLPDQGRFMVGYYQQRQDFFTKKDKENEKEKENVEQ